MMILTSMERVSTPLMAVSKAMVAACEFFNVIDAPLPASGTLKLDPASLDLVFDDVTFEYPSRPGAKVLDSLAIRIRSGQNTALVGPSGSGKSTIVGLLERWYSLKGQHILPQVVEAKKPETPNDEKADESASGAEPVIPVLLGTVKVGDHDLEELDLRWWRSQIGLVQQEPFLFNDTIFGNVSNGLLGTEWEDEPEKRKRELVQEACQEAHAHEFVSNLPNVRAEFFVPSSSPPLHSSKWILTNLLQGYDTRVGDGGIQLSGGQKQRIAIARSIIKNPQIMILDEATSALDTKSEKVVQGALDRVTKNRTTITIAHRLSTIKRADHIIVLQNGKAVEQGTHQDLMASPSGVYSALVKSQSLRLALDNEVVPETTANELDILPEKILGESNIIDGRILSPSNASTLHGNAPTPLWSLFYNFGSLLYKERRHWLYYVGIVLSSMAVAAGTPIQAWLFSKVVGVFLLSGDQLQKAGSFWGLMWFALAAGIGVSYFLMGCLSLRAQHSLSTTCKVQYLTDMLYQKLSFFDKDDNSHGTLSYQIATNAKQLEEILGLNLAYMLSGAFTVIGCIIIALIFGWKLGLVASLVAMPILLASGYWKYRHEMYFDQMNSEVFKESSEFATEAIGAMRTVCSLTMETTINRRYQRLLDGHTQAAFRKALWTSGIFGFTDSASLLCQSLVTWYGGRLLARGEYTMESFLVIFMAIIQGAEAASQALSIAPDMAQAKVAMDRLRSIQESTDVRRGEKNENPLTGADGGVEIELRDIHFSYPTRDLPVFEGLSLSIEKGQYVAFVGPSGCGKTTVISLLERFYEPNQGTILCNGANVKDLDVYKYREALSLIAQEPTMFRGTIRDNILFGIADPGSFPAERLHQICRDAFIYEFIVSLPEGYDTEVGQKGILLSGGQKQRIAIARALARDPKILLLDEATSALDSGSEKMVQSALEGVRKGRTMIAVAHRLSTIQNADVIFVFDNGKVVEKSSHDELDSKQGVYWDMVRFPSISFSRVGTNKA